MRGTSDHYWLVCERCTLYPISPPGRYCAQCVIELARKQHSTPGEEE
jgi:hypothetical protein